jgi:hypothetical protein
MAPTNQEQEDLELALLNSGSKTAAGDEGTGSQDNVKRPNYLVGNNAKAISACTLYSVCSVSMIIVNKSLASR